LQSHSKPSQHATIRGFDNTGRLTFTCHLTADPVTDEAWIYQVDESAVERGAAVALKSKYGATVRVQMSVKESKKTFLSLEMEYICGTPLLIYMILELNI
jgi:hypothetical protein